jgi:hypothetical protein
MHGQMNWTDSSQKRHKWQQTHEEMFNILNYKRNANQNDTEIPSQPSQNGYHQENKQQQMLVRRKGKRDPHTLLVPLN